MGNIAGKMQYSQTGKQIIKTILREKCIELMLSVCSCYQVTFDPAESWLDYTYSITHQMKLFSDLNRI